MHPNFQVSGAPISPPHNHLQDSAPICAPRGVNESTTYAPLIHAVMLWVCIRDCMAPGQRIHEFHSNLLRMSSTKRATSLVVYFVSKSVSGDLHAAGEALDK
jgi:hypothetical protein